MAEIKLTKTELRGQELRKGQLEKYLPTLQLKKAMLQIEVNQASALISQVSDKFQAQLKKIEAFAYLLSGLNVTDLFNSLEIEETRVSYENIAGVEIPLLQEVRFSERTYGLYETPLWWDDALDQLKILKKIREELEIAKRRKELLEAELRAVSIRVNLFEKILIPRTVKNIKKIKIFLGDQQLAAVSQAKVAKAKIEHRKDAYDH